METKSEGRPQLMSPVTRGGMSSYQGSVSGSSSQSPRLISQEGDGGSTMTFGNGGKVIDLDKVDGRVN